MTHISASFSHPLWYYCFFGLGFALCSPCPCSFWFAHGLVFISPSLSPVALCLHHAYCTGWAFIANIEGIFSVSVQARLLHHWSRSPFSGSWFVIPDSCSVNISLLITEPSTHVRSRFANFTFAISVVCEFTVNDVNIFGVCRKIAETHRQHISQKYMNNNENDQYLIKITLNIKLVIVSTDCIFFIKTIKNKTGDLCVLPRCFFALAASLIHVSVAVFVSQ